MASQLHNVLCHELLPGFSPPFSIHGLFWDGNLGLPGPAFCKGREQSLFGLCGSEAVRTHCTPAVQAVRLRHTGLTGSLSAFEPTMAQCHQPLDAGPLILHSDTPNRSGPARGTQELVQCPPRRAALMRATAAGCALSDELESWAAEVDRHYNLQDPWIRRLLTHALSQPPASYAHQLSAVQRDLFGEGGALTPGGMRGRRFEQSDSSASDDSDDDVFVRRSEQGAHHGKQWQPAGGSARQVRCHGKRCSAPCQSFCSLNVP